MSYSAQHPVHSGQAGQPPQKAYDDYFVIDIENNRASMYVPLVVSIGNEVITEANKHYQMIKIERKPSLRPVH